MKLMSYVIQTVFHNVSTMTKNYKNGSISYRKQIHYVWITLKEITIIIYDNIRKKRLHQQSINNANDDFHH